MKKGQLKVVFVRLSGQFIYKSAVASTGKVKLSVQEIRDLKKREVLSEKISVGKTGRKIKTVLYECI